MLILNFEELMYSNYDTWWLYVWFCNDGWRQELGLNFVKKQLSRMHGMS